VNYFSNCTTVDALKKRYRELAKTYHPDRNPASAEECTRIMADINAAYDRLMKAAYRQEAGDDYSAATENAHLDIATILVDIVTLDGVDIEVCGTWVWVGGNTKPHKDTLARLGFRWSSNKVKWYKAAAGFQTGKRRGYYDMDQIRFRHGSVSVKGKEAGKLG
jgi:curved DNA-binding protein CbpA